jgi:hypothetical protein
MSVSSFIGNCNDGPRMSVSSFIGNCNDGRREGLIEEFTCIDFHKIMFYEI